MFILMVILAAVSYSLGGYYMKLSNGFSQIMPTVFVFMLFGLGVCLQAWAMRNEQIRDLYFRFRNWGCGDLWCRCFIASRKQFYDQEFRCLIYSKWNTLFAFGMNQSKDGLNKNVLWLDSSPVFAQKLIGRFMTSLEGATCTLKLEVVKRSLNGSMALDGIIFEIRGVVSSFVEAAYGVMLEPITNTPIALVKMTPIWWGVRLEIGVGL